MNILKASVFDTMIPYVGYIDSSGKIEIHIPSGVLDFDYEVVKCYFETITVAVDRLDNDPTHDAWKYGYTKSGPITGVNISGILKDQGVTAYIMNAFGRR